MRGLLKSGPLFVTGMERTTEPKHYEVNTEIMYKLGSIEAQLNSINSQLISLKATQDTEIAKLKTDVSALKDWKMLQLGAAAVISFVIGILTKVFPWLN